MEMMQENNSVLTFFGLSFAVKLVLSLMKSSKKPKNVEKVGYLAKIKLYPGKSLKGLALQKAQCTQEGLHHPSHIASDR